MVVKLGGLCYITRKITYYERIKRQKGIKVRGTFLRLFPPYPPLSHRFPRHYPKHFII